MIFYDNMLDSMSTGVELPLTPSETGGTTLGNPGNLSFSDFVYFV